MYSDGERRRLQRGRWGKFVGAILSVVVGGLAMAAGFVLAQARTDEDATGFGVLAGIGLGFLVVGVVVAFKSRPWDRRWMRETPQARRDRLQSGRSRQLAIIPIVTLLFLGQAFSSLQDVAAGDGRPVDFLRIAVPVLYAWLTAVIVMGWDARSRKNRAYMDDELAQSLRARAIVAAFFVMMTGATFAMIVGLTRPEMGIACLPLVLAATGMTAGLRFAWLDREAGRGNG